MIERGRKIAGHVLEAAFEDIEFAGGNLPGRRHRPIDRHHEPRGSGPGEHASLPDDLADGLGARCSHDTSPISFPNGCHVCEVEIDPDTGETAIDRYTVVDDFGTVLNPPIVEGQVHGGIVQGLGQVLLENTVYDDDGQLVTGSYMDYAMPRADHMAAIDFTTHPVPCTTNPLGVKGCGEAGNGGCVPRGDPRRVWTRWRPGAWRSCRCRQARTACGRRYGRRPAEENEPCPLLRSTIPRSGTRRGGAAIR